MKLAIRIWSDAYTSSNPQPPAPAPAAKRKGAEAPNPFSIYRSVEAPRCAAALRRAGIDPVIGHLEDDHRMRRNFLRGELGDAANCLLAGAAFNLVKRLNQLKMMPLI